MFLNYSENDFHSATLNEVNKFYKIYNLYIFNFLKHYIFYKWTLFLLNMQFNQSPINEYLTPSYL